MDETTIRISKQTKKLLDEAKLHHRETYEDVIKRLLETVKKEKG